MIVYCSIPAINRRDVTLADIQDQIYLPHVTMNYMREHDAYMVDRVRQADCLIVMHKDNQFDFLIDSLTDNVKKDVQEAIRLGKKIYLAYRMSGGTLNIYETNISAHHMKGMAGSSRAFNAYLRDNDVDKFISESESQYKAQEKHVAQIGKQIDTSQYYDEGYPFNVPKLQEKVISTIDLRKHKYDRRLLI